MVARREEKTSRRLVSVGLFLSLLGIYSANGRETPTYDSQPTKLAARELALHGTLTLDRVIAETPAYAERPAFQRDRQGHFRSAYSVVPSILAAIPASMLHAARVVDLRAPLGATLIAKLTASLLTAAAVTLTFAALQPVFGLAAAVLVAVGLGLGTNLWSIGAGTLWQAETVAFGLALALFGWFRPARDVSPGLLWAGGIGVALAAATRPQDAPLFAVLLASLPGRVGWRRAVPVITLVASVAVALAAWNLHLFGSVLGGTAALEQSSVAGHAVSGHFGTRPWLAAAGLLVSPNRGLLVFSPVVAVAFVGIPALLRLRPSHGQRWWLAGGFAQFVLYSCYSVWWGGHTYGPRYLLDVLIPLAPAAAAAIGWIAARRWRQALGLLLLAYSVLVAATGAFVYPAEGWNGGADVDTHHERLWDWRDTQIARCWKAGLSPQNFALFDSAAWRPAASRATDQPVGARR